MMPRNRRSPKSVYSWIAGLVITGIVLLFKMIPAEGPREAVVVKVIDGDTVIINSGEHVRLIGIDTPELHESEKLFADARRTGKDTKTIKAQGQRAYEFTKSWVLGQRIQLEFDAQKKDKYGRLLGYIFLEFPRPPLVDAPREGFILNYHDKKWYFLNATIIQQGYASPMTIPPNVKYADIFKSLYEQAREYKRGLWQDSQNNKRKTKEKKM